MADSYTWTFKFWKCSPYTRRKLRAYREACAIWGYPQDITERTDYYICLLDTQSRSDRDDMVRYTFSKF